MKAEDAVRDPDAFLFGGLGVRDPDGVEGAVEVGPPKRQEFTQARKLRGNVELLPNEGLEKVRVIGHSIGDFGGCETIALQILCLRR